MENKEVRQYLINFVENTLNECKSFSKVYGKEFVKEKLEENVKKVNIDISNDNINKALYDVQNSCITLFYGNNFSKRLTVTDIENNKKLKHLILHESIHAIFKRTKEECKKLILKMELEY